MPLQRNDDFLVVSRASNDTSYKVKYEKIVQEASIDDLNDVDSSGADPGDVLLWNNTNQQWEAGPPPVQAPLFQGTKDCTTEGPDGGETDGQFYLNTGTGTATGAWGLSGGAEVLNGGELIISDGAGGWTNAGEVGGTPTVLSVDAGTGLKHAAGTTNIGAVELEVDTDELDLLYAEVDHDHPNANASDPGFMSSTDKMKLDAATAAATPSTLMMRDADASTAVNAIAAQYYDLSGLTELT